MCVMPLVGEAPCQCFSPGGIHTTSPGRILAHRTSLGLGPADARDDIQRLAQGMRMPCRARARLEGYAGRDNPRRRFGGDDWILPDRARKILLGCLARRPRTGEMDVHGVPP